MLYSNRKQRRALLLTQDYPPLAMQRHAMKEMSSGVGTGNPRSPSRLTCFSPRQLPCEKKLQNKAQAEHAWSITTDPDNPWLFGDHVPVLSPPPPLRVG